jgi:hypothetical protein
VGEVAVADCGNRAGSPVLAQDWSLLGPRRALGNDWLDGWLVSTVSYCTPSPPPLVLLSHFMKTWMTRVI